MSGTKVMTEFDSLIVNSYLMPEVLNSVRYSVGAWVQFTVKSLKVSSIVGSPGSQSCNSLVEWVPY